MILKKTLDTVLTIALVIVLVLMSLLSLFLLISSASNDGVASVFGYSPIVLYDTKSMEPTFGAKDLVIVKQQDPSKLEAGEIISFWGFVDGNRSIITHRIHEVVVLEDGSYEYITKGDNNELTDQDPHNDYGQDNIRPIDVIGVYVMHIPGFGSALNFIKSPTGVLVCLVIPIALVFLWQLYRVIRLAMAYHREQQAVKNSEMNEEQKQKIIEEYLRQQQALNASEEQTPPPEE